MEINPFRKRRRGRPRKEESPNYVPPPACANCMRTPCTSGLSDRVKAQIRDHRCVNYTRWPFPVE